MTKALAKRNNVGNRWLDSIFEDFFSVPNVFDRRSIGFTPRVNITDSADHLIFDFEVPGMEKKDIKVTITNNVLSVSGKRELRSSSDDEVTVREEIITGSFERQFTLPDVVQADTIKAEYKNGLLQVKLAKKEEVKPKEIEIKIS